MSRNLDSAPYAALVSGAAIIDHPQQEWLVASGEDRHRFVNGLVTCDVRELESGSGAYGFFTSAQGRVLADVVVTATEQALILDLPAGGARLIADHMLRYKVADRVEINEEEGWDQFIVAGPRSASLLEEVSGQSVAGDDWGRREADGVAFHGDRRLGVEATRVVGPRATLATLAGSLEAGGAVRAGAADLAAVRIERGKPWFGVDFSADNFPQESGLESETVSYTKGCYLGQEIVARIHYRGGVNRRILGLLSSEPIAVGGDLFAGDECVGKITSTARSSALGGYIALAMVHRKADGTVRLADGTTLALVELPFVS
jgi:folate-binding protein YgfZ